MGWFLFVDTKPLAVPGESSSISFKQEPPRAILDVGSLITSRWQEKGVTPIKIYKFPESMTSKERIARTFNYEKVDRVSIGYEDNPEINRKLCKALGVKQSDPLALLKCLGVDYAGVYAYYTGPSLFPQIPNRNRNAITGAVTKCVTNDYGSYWDFCDFPLKNAEPEDIAAYPCPSPDDFDYDRASNEVRRLCDEGFAVHLGNPGMGDILNVTGTIMGVEDALVNISTEEDATLGFIDRRIAMELALTERLLEMNKGLVDFLWIGEDLGTQHAPLISLDMYRKILRPRHQKYIDLAKAYNLPIIIHTCGSSSWVYEDFIEMGINGVDTLQPEATNMSPEYLVSKYGGRLNFRGCISTAGVLAYGSAKETEDLCRKTLEIMRPCGGYHFAPTHQIQDNTPVENIIAMYNAAHR